MIPFNKPYLTGKETEYISEAIFSGKLSGDGLFTKKCQKFLERAFGFKKVLLTTSCTDALEMAAILIDTKIGDEVIVPSYTFVSTANAFVLRGATIRFADSGRMNPNIDVTKLEGLITKKTKAIVVVHYAGIACEMDAIMKLAAKYGLFVIEDAAQAIDSYYYERPLGSLGHLSAFSFHESKNIICGEGGMLVINDDRFLHRSEIIREKGTNRSAFFRGDVKKYEWVDIGSSFLPAEVIAAFLLAQIENIDSIQARRKLLWNIYKNNLAPLELDGKIELPHIPNFATNNAHMFYIMCGSRDERTLLLEYLSENGIMAVFHYLSLHKSPFYLATNIETELLEADRYTERLLRLPMYYDLKEEELEKIVGLVKRFYANEEVVTS